MLIERRVAAEGPVAAGAVRGAVAGPLPAAVPAGVWLRVTPDVLKRASFRRTCRDGHRGHALTSDRCGGLLAWNGVGSPRSVKPPGAGRPGGRTGGRTARPGRNSPSVHATSRADARHRHRGRSRGSRAARPRSRGAGPRSGSGDPWPRSTREALGSRPRPAFGAPGAVGTAQAGQERSGPTRSRRCVARTGRGRRGASRPSRLAFCHGRSASGPTTAPLPAAEGRQLGLDLLVGQVRSPALSRPRARSWPPRPGT
jgi:hypothetical protein